jgi:hypothetical protein
MPIINHFGDVKTRGNLTVLGVFSNFSGNIYAANALSTTNVIASGNVSGANLASQYNVWAGSNVNSVNVWATGNVTAANLVSSGNLWAASNVNGTNVWATGNISAASNVNGANLYVTGNIWGQNLVSSGNLWASSNVNSVNVWATGNISAANLASSGNLWAASNVNGTNVWATGNISAASNVNGTNLYVTGNIWGQNLTSQYNVWAASNVNSVNVWATGNVSAANLTSSGNLWAASNVNGANLYVTGNIWGQNLTSQYNVWAGSNVNATNVWATGNLVSSGNVWAGTTSNVNAKNVWATANISGVTINASNFLIAGAVGTTNQVLQATGTGAGIQWGTISALSGLTTGAVLYATSATSASTTGTASNFYWDNTNSRLGLGTATPGYPLHVTATGVATASSAYSNLAFQTGGWYQAYNAAGTRTLKIYTDGNIGCAELDLFSDQRIKKDIEDVSEAEAALLVSELRPRTFRYTDTIEYGPERVNGLIAQEVLRVVPSAVSTHEGVVPDVFKTGKVSGDWIAVEGAFAPGDVLKVLDGDEIHMVSVVEVRGDGSVRVDKELKGAEVFVYGREVQDFHTVSYERIVPLLISTIQSLQKRVAILENKSQ